MAKKRTAEQRERYRLAAIKRGANPEYIKKLKAACKERSQGKDYKVRNAAGLRKWYKENPDFVTRRNRKIISAPGYKEAHHAGLLASIPQRSATMKKKWQDPVARKMYLSCIGSNRQPEYLDECGRIWRFRSTWELRFAKWLDREGFTWLYEPCALFLSNGRVYIPDFWVKEWDSYIEIKGYRNQEKTQLALEDGHPVIVISDEKVLQEVTAWAT